MTKAEILALVMGEVKANPEAATTFLDAISEAARAKAGDLFRAGDEDTGQRWERFGSRMEDVTNEFIDTVIEGKFCALGRGEVDPCGRVATKEVTFADDPGKWYPACSGCIRDRAGAGPEMAITKTRNFGGGR